MRIAHTLPLLALAASLAACGGSSGSGSFFSNDDGDDPKEEVDDGGDNTGGDGGAQTAPNRIVSFKRAGATFDTLEANTASCATKVRLDGGRSYQVTLPSASGETISFQVIEPKKIDCLKGNPLVLHGHGFGGARTEDPKGSFLERLQDNGYAVISIDQRGFNDSSGTVRVMDPDYEGQDLIQIFDWAEKNLDYLVYERPSEASPYNIVAGANGGSYGGMYQMLLHNIDPKSRLDALTPDITPHDLRTSLYPGGAVKSAWVALLVVGGEAGANKPIISGLDPAIKETLVKGVTSNEIPTPSLNFFYYHSAKYFGADDGTDISNMDFLTSMLSPPTKPIYVGDKKPAPKKVDILFSQGMRDTLFNFNEAWANYQAYKNLGGDVRLMTHEGGHILPGTQTVIGALGPLNMLTDPLLGGLDSVGLSLPDLQKPGGSNNCGALSRDDADLAFLNEKLNPPQKEAASLATVTALEQLKTSVCLSLSDGPDGAVFVESEQIAAKRAETKIPASIIPVPNAALGLTSLLLPTFIPLEGFKGPLAIGGIGQLNIKLNNVLEPLNGCDLPLGLPAELTNNIPAPLSGLLGLLPVKLPIRACDAIVLVGFGAKKGMAAPRLIDEQMQPVRGLGEHKVSMVGVAEKLAEGEQLGLMVYGYNLQYLTSLSRDLLVPAVTISGTVEVPVLAN